MRAIEGNPIAITTTDLLNEKAASEQRLKVASLHHGINLDEFHPEVNDASNRVVSLKRIINVYSGMLSSVPSERVNAALPDKLDPVTMGKLQALDLTVLRVPAFGVSPSAEMPSVDLGSVPTDFFTATANRRMDSPSAAVRYVAMDPAGRTETNLSTALGIDNLAEVSAADLEEITRAGSEVALKEMELPDKVRIRVVTASELILSGASTTEPTLTGSKIKGENGAATGNYAVFDGTRITEASPDAIGPTPRLLVEFSRARRVSR